MSNASDGGVSLPEVLLTEGMAEAQPCDICSSNTFTPASSSAYLRCKKCGHEILVTKQISGLVTNEIMSADVLHKPSFVVREQIKISAPLVNAVQSSKKAPVKIMDFGCGSGAFLYHLQKSGLSVSGIGVEGDPPSVRFARDTAHLTIVERLDSSTGSYDIATFWHALEHLEPAVARSVLLAVREGLPPNGLLLICVPNGDSWFYRAFGKAYPYLDVSAHPVNFSGESLDILVKDAGFTKQSDRFSFAYSGFGYLQGLLNFGSRERNYLYRLLRRGQEERKLSILLGQAALSAMLLPFAILGVLLDAILPRKGMVLLSIWTRT